MNYVVVFDQVMKEYKNKEVAILAAVLVGINMATNPTNAEMVSNDQKYYKRICKLQAEASWEYSPEVSFLAKRIADVWFEFCVSHDLQGLGSCKPKLLRELIEKEDESKIMSKEAKCCRERVLSM